MALSIQWNEGVSSEMKWLHTYKGYVAHRNKEYQNLWGPVLDGNGQTVDGLPGLYNDLSAMQREIDRHIKEMEIRNKALRDALIKAGALEPVEPGHLVEQPTDE